MPALYKNTNYSLTHLIEDIKHGNIALPDIQRPFVWSAAKVRDLFDSMYRGYPVGTLMFWETGAEVGMRQVGGGNSERVRQQTHRRWPAAPHLPFRRADRSFCARKIVPGAAYPDCVSSHRRDLRSG